MTPVVPVSRDKTWLAGGGADAFSGVNTDKVED
jgi:hypothetical protein